MIRIRLVRIEDNEVVKELEVPKDSDLFAIQCEYDVIYGALRLEIVEEVNEDEAE